MLRQVKSPFFPDFFQFIAKISPAPAVPTDNTALDRTLLIPIFGYTHLYTDCTHGLRKLSTRCG